ncbi:MAG: Holliday junction branch migration DNA helicase RuvB [Bacillota bacterium]|nr:Holliday junction branch migration DNA helicase RuvB [Bacillota bacterium]
MRERLVSPQERPEEERYQSSLRPRAFDEYIGQQQVVERLRVAVTAARERGEPLDHVLFYGPPGLGKTTLAHVIAHELGVPLVQSSGPAIERPGDLMGVLTNLEPGSVLFIDEIHRLPRAVEEFLYPAMEDYRVDFVVDKGPFAKSIRLDIPPFTLVGATTRAGLLAAPLRERFGLFYHLDFYPPEELRRIVARSARLLGVELEPEAEEVIARRSRGTPRITNRLLRRVRDYAQVGGVHPVTARVAEEALALEGIDARGLDALDRHYLEVLIRAYEGGPVGVAALAATLNEEADTLTDVVEPYLLKIGFLRRTAQGRRSTRAAEEHLGLSPDAGQPALF